MDQGDVRKLEVELLDPTAELDLATGGMAPRPPDLRGRTIGLLDNGKWNAGPLLVAVAEGLRERHGAAIGLHRSKPRYNHEVAPETVEEIRLTSAAVLVAIGD